MSRGIEGTQSAELTLPNFGESSAKSPSWLGAVERVGNSWRFAYTKMDTSFWREGRIAPITHFDHESGRQISPVYQTLSIGRGLTKNFGFGVASAHLGVSLLRGYGYTLGCNFVASSSPRELPEAEHCRYEKHSDGGVYFQVDASIGAFLGLGVFLRYIYFSSIGKEIDIGISVPIGRFHRSAGSTLAE